MPVPVAQLVPAEGELGCLLLHGLTGTPAEMLPVAEALAGRLPLWVARVAGHETTVAELARSSWPDWYASAVAGADALARVAPRIAVVGLSMGALLALRLAAERPQAVAGIALLSPAAAIGRRRVRWLRWALEALGGLDTRSPRLRDALGRIAMRKGGSDIADLVIREEHPGYRAVPLRALLSLLALQRRAWLDAPRVMQPVLTVHAVQDHTAPLRAALRLHRRLGSRDKRLVLLGRSFHVVTVDRERARVLAEVEAFVARLAPEGLRAPDTTASPAAGATGAAAPAPTSTSEVIVVDKEPGLS